MSKSEPDPEDAADWGDDRGISGQFDKILSQLRREIRTGEIVSQLQQS